MENYPEIAQLGKKIRVIREKKDMTQMDLAVATSKDTATISRIERGVTNPTFTLVIDIARALGVSLKELVTF